jgi:hypothetical protein
MTEMMEGFVNFKNNEDGERDELKYTETGSRQLLRALTFPSMALLPKPR